MALNEVDDFQQFVKSHEYQTATVRLRLHHTPSLEMIQELHRNKMAFTHIYTEFSLTVTFP